MTQKYQVKVSMKQAAVVETGIVLKQGDFGMQLEIEVLDFDATGTTPQIVFRKAMGAVESTTITVSGNKYTYTFKGTELDTPGKCFCDLKLKNSTTQRISTASFMFKVVADTMDGLEEEASSYSDTIAQIVDGFEEEVEGLEKSLDILSGKFDILRVGDKINALYIGNPYASNYLYGGANMNRFVSFVDDEGNTYYLEADSQSALSDIWNSVSFFGLKRLSNKDYFYNISNIIKNEDLVYYQNDNLFGGVPLLLFGGDSGLPNRNSNKAIYFKKSLTVTNIVASEAHFVEDFKNILLTEDDKYASKELFKLSSVFGFSSLRTGDVINGLYIGNPQGENYLVGNFTRFIQLQDDEGNNLYFEVDSSTAVPPMYNRVVLFGLNNNQVYDISKLLKPNNLIKYNNSSYWGGHDVIPFGGDNTFDNSETNRNCYVFFEKPMTVVTVRNNKYMDTDFRSASINEETSNSHNLSYIKPGNLSSYVHKKITLARGNHLIYESNKAGMITKMQFIASWNYALARSTISVETDGVVYFQGMLYDLCGMNAADFGTSAFINNYADLFFESSLFSKKGTKVVTLNYKIPFYRNVKIYLKTPTEALMWNCITVSDSIDLHYPGLNIPFGAYLHSQHSEEDNVAVGGQLQILNTKRSGALLGFELFGSGKNVNWCEGCLRAYIKGSSDPVVISSGWEDTFGFCFFFDAGVKQFRDSGVTILQREEDNVTIIAYRNFDTDPITFESGGFILTVRNGDQPSDQFDLNSTDNIIDNDNLGLYPAKMGGQVTWYEW